MLRLLPLLLLLPVMASAGELHVMSYNLWVGGHAGKQPLSQSVAVIQAAKADIVGLQETHGGSPRSDRSIAIAKALGWHHFDQGARTAVISRFPIRDPSPKKWGVRIDTPEGEVALFNVHFPPAPYQPYQLLNIPYGKGRFIKTSREAVEEARKARGANLQRMFDDLKTLTNSIPVFITGDFNEPSHQDWTAAAVAARRCPLPVEWPATKAVVELGFTDGYRAVFPDVVKHRGWTWTNTTAEDDPKDRHDRIDFVFGRGATPTKAWVVGEKPDRADIVVTPFPSDHRAVVVRYERK